MNQPIKGQNRPAQMSAVIPDRAAMKGQYIRHRDTGEIYRIAEVGREGVTAYQVEGFDAPVIPNAMETLITWPSLKYKHVFMIHVADVDVKPEHQL